MGDKIEVYFSSQEEVEEVQARAKIAGFDNGRYSGVSPYMRELALGYEPISYVDKEVVEKQSKISLDLVRVGNLLKASILYKPPHDLDEVIKHLDSLKKWGDELESFTLQLRRFVREKRRAVLDRRKAP